MEESGAARGWRELPLFPLSTVLFPGAVLQLHVFERRYRLMIRECLRRPEPAFGVLLIKEGAEVIESPEGEVVRPPAVPYSVGTVAHIVEAAPLDNGGYLVIGLGLGRIRLRRVVQQEPYLIGEVEPLYDEAVGDSAPRCLQAALRLRQASREMLQAMVDAVPASDVKQRMRIQALIRSIPTEATELSFFVPRLLGHTRAAERQALLESCRLQERLEREEALLAAQRQQLGQQPGGRGLLSFETGVPAPSLN